MGLGSRISRVVERIYEGEPASRSRIPGVGRNLVEGGLQLRLERSDVRDVSHEDQIYIIRLVLPLLTQREPQGHHRPPLDSRADLTGSSRLPRPVLHASNAEMAAPDGRLA